MKNVFLTGALFALTVTLSAAPVYWLSVPSTQMVIYDGTNTVATINAAKCPATNELKAGFYEIKQGDGTHFTPRNWMINVPAGSSAIDGASLMRLNTNATVTTIEVMNGTNAFRHRKLSERRQ